MILQPHPDSDNNMLQILSDIPEVTEEMSSTLKREAAASNSQLSEYANGRLNCSFLWSFVQCYIILLNNISIITKKFICLLHTIVTHAWSDDQTDSLVKGLSNQQNVSTQTKVVHNENNNDCAKTANLILPICINSKLHEDSSDLHKMPSQVKESNDLVLDIASNKSKKLAGQLENECNFIVYDTDNSPHNDHEENDLVLATNPIEVKDFCTLLPSGIVDSLKKKNNYSGTNKEPHSKKRLKKETFLKEMSRKNNDLAKKVTSNLLYIEQAKGAFVEPTHLKDIFEPKLKVTDTKRLSKKLTSCNNQTLGRKKKLKQHKDLCPSIPQLLSLGSYDDIKASIEDAQSYQGASKVVIRYHEGSLFYEHDNNEKGEPNECRGPSRYLDKNQNISAKRLKYESGKYDACLNDLDTNSRCIDRRAFAGMQYAIRKELDRTLQKNEIQNNFQETVLQPNDFKCDPKGNSDERLQSNPSIKMTNGVTEDKDCRAEELGTQAETQRGIKELKDMLKMKTCVLLCKCGSELHNEATCSQMNICEQIVINSDEACQSEAEVDVDELRQFANDRLQEETAVMDLGKSLRQ